MSEVEDSDRAVLPPPEGAKALMAIGLVFVVGVLVGLALGLAL